MPLSDADRLKLLTPRSGRLRAVLDTVTYNEIDDQFALVQAILSPERIDLQAIYAAPFHNSRSDGPGHGMELSYGEILELLGRLGISPDGLVHRGVTEYVGRDKVARPAAAVDDLIARARAGSIDDPLYVVAIGAISNVASILAGSTRRCRPFCPGEACRRRGCWSWDWPQDFAAQTAQAAPSPATMRVIFFIEH